MPDTDPRIDAYIDDSADFAKPILQRFRKLVHKGCPDVKETMKWSFPHFEYKGILCNMAAFKQYCSFGFWKASLMRDPDQLLKSMGKTAMARFDKITSLKDLPPDKVLLSYIKEAARLNEENVNLPAKPKGPIKEKLAIPDYMQAALQKNKNALVTFENFNPTHKREYIEWITGAKAEATRNTRLQTAIEWMEEGKIRHWKYAK